MRDTALAELLLDGPVLIAFDIVRIALQIHRDIRAYFNNGVDLSTLCSLSTREIASPSRLVGTRVSHMANYSKIDSLWYGGGKDESSDREVALRAWISALYVRCLWCGIPADRTSEVGSAMCHANRKITES
jgi:hypothetical protein